MSAPAPTVADVAREVTGSTWQVDQTGGGCTALSTTLEGGFVLVLCNDLNAPQWGDTDLSLGVYRWGAWHGDDDDRDAVADDWTSAPVTPDVVRQMVGTMLDALPTLLAL